MGIRTALLVGVAVLGAGGSALAADLPPPPVYAPPPIEPIETGGWYLRGDVGVGITSQPEIDSNFATRVPKLRHEQEELGDAAFVGVGVGYQINNWFRADVTGEYRTSQSLSGTESFQLNQRPNNRPFDQYTGNLQSTVGLINGYVDLGTWWGLTPFIGAGVGGSYNRIYGLTDMGFPSVYGRAGGGFGYAKQSGNFDLAYAGYAGLSYAVSPNLKLELAYRYLDMGEATSAPIICKNTRGGGCTREVQNVSLQSNDIKLGMRWMFNDYAPPPPVPVYAPPPPLVRKY